VRLRKALLARNREGQPKGPAGRAQRP